MTLLCHGSPPLTGATQKWMEALLADPDSCARLLARFGSPLNVLDFESLRANIEELARSGDALGVDVQVFVARKANKTLSLISAAASAGGGLDVASYAELRQTLDHGVNPDRIIVTAAVKDAALLELAVAHGVTISVDNLDEAADIAELSKERGQRANVALRLGITHPMVPATRFGLTGETWMQHIDTFADVLTIQGVHFHLNGYDRQHRVFGLVEACDLVDRLRQLGHPIEYIDMGGGIPMRYLSDESQWRTFWRALDADTQGALTWRGDRLGLVRPEADRPSDALYPYWQPEARGSWLTALLTTPVDDTTAAQMITERGLQLRCEPGRSILDGCGMTLANVVFRKTTSDGIPLVGLQMNRTQMRSTSADVLIDPRWIRPRTAEAPTPPGDAFLVGAYCIEDELILRRRLTFPEGVARGDIAAFVNTAGYLMHILESPSHQLPLAQNLIRTSEGWKLDQLPAPERTSPTQSHDDHPILGKAACAASEDRPPTHP